MDEADVPAWLFDECYEAVGDLAETIACCCRDAESDERSLPLHRWVGERLLPLASQREDEQRASVVLASWRELDGTARFVWNKLITGGFRVGVSQQLVVRALAQCERAWTKASIAHRLSGTWLPTAEWFTALVAAETSDADVSRPYPFFLAYPLEGELDALGDAVRVAGRVEVGRHPRPGDPPRAGRRSSGRAARSS